MSHSKFIKRGQSMYINNWNPSAKKYINTCFICGKQGYSPAIEEADFIDGLERKVTYVELKKMFPAPLSLDSLGRCEECAKRMDR